MTGAEWQQQSYLWAGLGWGQKPKPGRMTSELCTSPTQPTGHASAKLTHTGAHIACCVALLLTPWNCSLPSLPNPSTREYLWNLWGGGVFWRHLVAMKHEVGWQKLTNISLKQIKRTWEWNDGFSSYSLSIILYCIKFMCMRRWVSVMQGSENTFLYKYTHISCISNKS